MKKKDSEEYDLKEKWIAITREIPYLLAGLESRTDGHWITSITIQQDGDGGFRAILKSRDGGNGQEPASVVSFTSANDPATCLLHVEKGYRDDALRWHVDKFAESAERASSKKARSPGISITD